jgi:hypothetical protein
MRQPLLLTTLTILATTLLFAMPASAEPRIKTNGCKVYATNRVDPIASTRHLHHHFGNTQTSNRSTGESLKNRGGSSCAQEASWFTSGAWFPVARGVRVERIAVYYRAPGDQRRVRSIPTGLRILAHDPIIGNRGRAVTMHFPDCVGTRDGSPVLDSANHESHTVFSKEGRCPSTHPYRIPRITYLIQYAGRVSASTQVSMGEDQWGRYADAMHADYLAGNRPVFDERLIGLCLRKAKDSQTVAHPDCGKGP